MSFRVSRAVRAVAFASVVALMATACGGDDDDADDSATTTASATETTASESTETTAADSTETTAAESTETTAAESTDTTAAAGDDPFGTPNAASGDPVKVGYISDGQSAAIDNTDELLTAEATVEYANEYLGGLAGRPIDLVTCETKQDAALATDCANQMLEEDVVAVLFNVSGQSTSIAKPLQDANMPLFAGQAADIATDAESTFVLSNGLASFAHPATVARDNGFTKEATIVIDVPGASGPAKSLGVAVLANAGVPAAEVVAIAPGTADMGPQVQAALGNGPELVHIIGDAGFCTTALQALEAAGYDGTITAISQCIADSTIESIGDYLEGILVSYTATIDPEDPDYQTFVAVVDKYADDPDRISLTSNPVGAFAVVTNFVRLMADATGDITQESVISTAKSTGPVPMSMGAGLTFKCDGTAVAILPAVCTAGFVEATLDADGQPANFTEVDPGDILKLG